jgi:ATP-dependent exoDNAse (exonuclease V) alpha subunit
LKNISKSLSEKQPLGLSKEFIDILDILENTQDHYFITGRAGTGKSTLLQLFRKTSKKRIAVVAPTGIAALNVQGQTIHSFFGFPPKMIDRKDIVKRKSFRFYKKIDAIVIDEISMVRADMMDNINIFLQKNREIALPFGGVQMIFFGDLFQLPPVIASDFEKRYFREFYESPYFFSSEVIQNQIELQMIELNEVYRQAERRFINLLDNIRQRSFDYDDLEDLNSRHTTEDLETDEYYITLCSTNSIADGLNYKKLRENQEREFLYPANISGQFKPSIFPTDQILKLKKGAQVMFVKNDPQRRFVNGTIGKISSLEVDEIKVVLKNEQKNEYEEIVLEKMEWEVIRYTKNSDQLNRITSETIGIFVQFPIKLAWAITIHKSQGKTFERVIIDLGRGAFEYGQTYVALSRCKTLNGIILKKPIQPRDIIMDPKVLEYYEFKRYYS